MESRFSLAQQKTLNCETQFDGADLLHPLERVLPFFFTLAQRDLAAFRAI
jgi:hypothetical protein